jgi:heptosyltransferase I
MSTLPPWTGGRLGVVMMSALGDAVHVLPLLDTLKHHAPATHVTWVLQPGPAEMVRGHPHVDDVIIFQRGRGLGAYAEVRREFARRAPFDLLLNLQVYFKAGLVTMLAPARVKLGFDRSRARDLNWLFTSHRIAPHAQQHVQDQYFEFLDAIGVRHGEPVWNLGPTAEEQARAKGMAPDGPGPLVGLVVATSKAEKNWMPERYAELALRLHREIRARVVLLGGTMPIERAAAEVILREASAAQPINALGSGLRTLIGLLARCDVVVSSDTGPFHMCVAMNVPAVGLYGYTNPKRVGPYRRFTDLVIDAYGEPGEDYPVSMQYRHDRMPRITVDAVEEKVRLALARYRNWY